MPRFSEKEKIQIRESLLTEGEQLFWRYGLQKVTIDDLIAAVKIAKASFYRFYTCKEELYLDILQKEQKLLMIKLEKLLCENKNDSNKDRVRQVFEKMYVWMQEFPLLGTVDVSMMGVMTRKIPATHLLECTAQGSDMIVLLQKAGISFLYDTEVVACSFSMLYHCWVELKQAGEAMQKQVIKIMLEGMIDQMCLCTSSYEENNFL